MTPGPLANTLCHRYVRYTAAETGPTLLRVAFSGKFGKRLRLDQYVWSLIAWIQQLSAENDQLQKESSSWISAHLAR